MNNLFRNRNKTLAIDLGGNDHTKSFEKMIINLRANQFEYGGWPFKHQTIEELEQYLFNFDGVRVLKIADKDLGLIFVPISKNNNDLLISKLNYEKISITIAGNFTSNIKDVFKGDENEKDLPFIFDNAMQTSPKQLQSQLFKELERGHNFGVANRINKNKKAIIRVKNGQALEVAVKANYEMDDYSPFTIVEDGDKKIRLILTGWKNMLIQHLTYIIP